jgi:hypothetical protein
MSFWFPMPLDTKSNDNCNICQNTGKSSTSYMAYSWRYKLYFKFHGNLHTIITDILVYAALHYYVLCCLTDHVFETPLLLKTKITKIKFNLRLIITPSN